jgi:hypothetical protein
MPAPTPDSQAPGLQTQPGSAPPPVTGGGHVYLAAIRAFVAADRLNAGLDTHSGQNAYDQMKAAKRELYRLADLP